MWCKLGDLFDVISAKRVHKSDWVESGIPFYRAREIVKLANEESIGDNKLYISESFFKELSETSHIPTLNDIMLTAVGSIGRVYIVQKKRCILL